MFGSKQSCALNISDHSIEILELAEERGSVVVSAYGRALLDSGIIEDGKIIQHDKLKLALKRLLQQTKPKPITAREIIIAIPESKVFVAAIDIPRSVGERNTAAAIASRARELIPIDPAETAADFISSRTTPEFKRYAYAATYRELLQDYQSLLQSLRLKATIITMESLALAHATVDHTADRTVLLIDIGARTTIASIFSAGILQDSINIRIAGNNLTNALVEKLKISESDAEQKKMSTGLSANNGNGAEMLILQGQLQPLKDELLLFIKYYEEKNNDTIDAALLAGGTAAMRGIEEYFESNIGLPTKRAEPLPQFASVLQPSSMPKFLVALGLASIPFQGKRPVLNFLTRSDRDWQQQEKVKINPAADDTLGAPQQKPKLKKNIKQTLVLITVLLIAGGLFASIWVWKRGVPSGWFNRSTPAAADTQSAQPLTAGRQVNVVVSPVTDGAAQKQSLSFSFTALLDDASTPRQNEITGSLREYAKDDTIVYDTATEAYVRTTAAANSGDQSNPEAAYTAALQQHLAHKLWERYNTDLQVEYNNQGKTLLPLYISQKITNFGEESLISDEERARSLSVTYSLLVLNSADALTTIAKPYVDAFTLANPGYTLESASYIFNQEALPTSINVTVLYTYVALNGNTSTPEAPPTSEAVVTSSAPTQ